MTRVASRHRTAEVTSWHERESRPVKEDRSRWVGIPSSFVEISLEIHASVRLHMHKGNEMLHNSPSALELTQAYCSFVRLFFFSHSLDCISCSYEEMCDAPIGTTSWSPAVKRNGFEEGDVYGGPREYRHSLLNSYKLILCILFINPSARAGYDTRSIFKRSLTGLNSEFSFT